RKDSGAVFPPDLNIQDARQAILTSDCPLQQYHIEIARLLGLDVEIFKNLGLSMHVCNGILIPGVVEEFVFRQVIQDWILKKGVRKAVECISPQHASFVDHKAYTACRILLSSLAFSAIHATNGVMFPDEYVSVQIRATFVMGIAFGILKEMVGLPAAMGAHMVQNTVALLPGMMTTC
ncbi:MAG: CPBP family intramembrane metalloprotease, partial [Chlamydiae bacterium]|nr:CPBP family intramembrane metalloprotease [Chlamydiota bacterium]